MEASVILKNPKWRYLDNGLTDRHQNLAWCRNPTHMMRHS